MNDKEKLDNVLSLRKHMKSHLKTWKKENLLRKNYLSKSFLFHLCYYF